MTTDGREFDNFCSHIASDAASSFAPNARSHSKITVPLQEPLPAPLPASSQASASKEGPKTQSKGKLRGKTSSRLRGGQALKAAGGNSYVGDTMRLQKKLITKGDFYKTGSYSIETNGSRVSTGRQSLRHKRNAAHFRGLFPGLRPSVCLALPCVQE